MVISGDESVLTGNAKDAGFCYPLPAEDLCNIHSGLVYNLESFRGARDGMGRGADGAWGLCNNRRFWGEDVWQGKLIPPRGISDGCWHGAIDLVPQGGRQLMVRAVAAGKVLNRFIHRGGNFSALLLHHSYENQHFYTIYQHLAPSGLPNVGQNLSCGEKLGRLAPLHGGVHLHFEIHSSLNLWDYTRINRETSHGFFIEYCKENGLTSQFSSSFFSPDLQPHYCYNGWAWLTHAQGNSLPAIIPHPIT